MNSTLFFFLFTNHVLAESSAVMQRGYSVTLHLLHPNALLHANAGLWHSCSCSYGSRNHLLAVLRSVSFEGGFSFDLLGPGLDCDAERERERESLLRYS